MNRAENIYHFRRVNMHGTKSGPGADPDYAERYHPGTGGKHDDRKGSKDSAIRALKRRVDGYVAGGQSRPFRRRTGRNSRDNVVYELDPAVAAKLNAAGVSTPLIEETTDIDRFIESITAGKASTKFGAQVSVLTPDEYADARLFLTPEGKAGFAIKSDGTLVSLFNHRDSPYRGVSASLVMLGVQEGGRKLDNYDTYLSKIYKRMGFREVERYDWDDDLKPEDWDYENFRQWNGGRPDYVFMEYDGG